ncbi:MAG: tRNA (adenosine(37)-N6)-threonylcarbamoyltransferase complex transferase subunit TsaD [bacterium]|nr:tRNA (adenosine(37)-N6)-threonylcarbamoyltransferase complex transferase subunit TsaD [bacterium]
MIKILAIETSCDETAFALIEASGPLTALNFKIKKSVISSQIAIHAEWGGVVPNIAKREHEKSLPLIFEKSFLPLIKKGLNIDILAITVGPGLAPCLWAGVNFAEMIHKKYLPKAKIIGVNHLEGHLYSFLAANPKNKNRLFPAIGLIASGGHTILLLMKSLTQWQKIGETRDDAVGETFDKVGRMLKLPYPGGPLIEKIASQGRSTINFPRPMINQKNYDFSFAGLKTALLYYLRDHQINEQDKNDVAASFQVAAIETLVFKTAKAAEDFKARSIVLAGGVAANKSLRASLKKEATKQKINFFAPANKLNTDNAAMIGVAAYINFLRKKYRPIKVQADLTV